VLDVCGSKLQVANNFYPLQEEPLSGFGPTQGTVDEKQQSGSERAGEVPAAWDLRQDVVALAREGTPKGQDDGE